MTIAQRSPLEASALGQKDAQPLEPMPMKGSGRDPEL